MRWESLPPFYTPVFLLFGLTNVLRSESIRRKESSVNSKDRFNNLSKLVEYAYLDLGLLGVRMTIKEIVEKYLTENGFDGLCHAYVGCGCRIGDLMPCDEPGVNCEAGHEGPGDPDEEIEFTIIPGRRA